MSLRASHIVDDNDMFLEHNCARRWMEHLQASILHGEAQ